MSSTLPILLKQAGELSLYRHPSGEVLGLCAGRRIRVVSIPPFLPIELIERAKETLAGSSLSISGDKMVVTLSLKGGHPSDSESKEPPALSSPPSEEFVTLLDRLTLETDMELYEEALVMTKKQYGDKSLEVATLLSGMGSALLHRGDHEEALEPLLQCFEIKKKIFNNKRDEVIEDLLEIARAYRIGKESIKGLYYALGAYKIAKAQHQIENELSALLVISTIHYSCKNNVKTVDYLMKVFALLQNFPRNDPQMIFLTLFMNGLIHHSIQRFGDALVFFKKTPKITEIWSSSNPNVSLLSIEGTTEKEKCFFYLNAAHQMMVNLWGDHNFYTKITKEALENREIPSNSR